MTNRTCTRLWEIEAARDGRLSNQARSAHEQHIARCEECQRERSYLESLARAIIEHEPACDEIALRRTRRAILQQAAEARMRERSPRSTRIRRLWGLGLSCAAAILAVVWLHSRPLLPEQPGIRVTPQASGSRWSRRRTNRVEHVELAEGAFELVVHRAQADPRLVVHVPEGEIEDLGTRFQVTISQGRTLRIAVREGSIVFHRSGLGDVRLFAGDIWRAADATKSLPPPAIPLARPVASAAPAPPPPPPPPPAIQQRRRVPVPSVRLPTTERIAVSDEYREDTSYLRVLTLLGEDRRAAARRAAFAYLTEFPNGFRRLEVQQIAQLGDIEDVSEVPP